MVTFIFICVAVAIFWCDYKAYQRLVCKSKQRLWHLIPMAAIAALHYVVGGISYLFTNDNPQVVQSILQWVLTIYIVTTAARAAFYAAWFTFSNRRLGATIGAILCTAVIYIFCNSILNTRIDYRVKHTKVAHNAIPESFDGFRILLFSDVHIGSMLSPKREIARLTEQIIEQRADMVIFGGDMTHIRHTELSSEHIATLSKITAPYGVYAVLGNHDTGQHIKDSIALPKHENTKHFCNKIRQAGWTMLRDSTIYAVRGADSIAVTGIDFTDELLEYKHSLFSSEEAECSGVFATLPDSMFNIAVSHLPQLWHTICENDSAELTLSGHVHAAQAVVECFGVRLSPAMLLYKEWSGLYREGDKLLYITDGIGCVGFNMRIGAEPEMTVIELSR